MDCRWMLVCWLCSVSARGETGALLLRYWGMLQSGGGILDRFWDQGLVHLRAVSGTLGLT